MKKKEMVFKCTILKNNEVINILESTGGAAKKAYTLYLHNFFNSVTEKRNHKYEVINKLNDDLKVKCTFENNLVYVYEFKNINIWEDQADEKH
ncbi:MAG: hypothetical protein R3Y05_01215 [bacterium]